MTGRAGLALVMIGAAGCGIALRRDLTALPPQSVIYDDMCGVQSYHDAIESGKSKGPRVLLSSDMGKVDGDRPIGGTATFGFDDEFTLNQLRRVLSENWDRLPPQVMTAQQLKVGVQWAEKAGVRRVVTTHDAEISDGKTTWYLPYQVCLSELIYGAPLYKTRRAMLGLPELPADAPPAPPAEIPPASPSVPSASVAPALR
jgi:hypothetical protein